MRGNGAIAQLGERLLCTQEVRSSILLGSTRYLVVVERWCWGLEEEFRSKRLGVLRLFGSGLLAGSCGDDP